jgi:hypothetical protein
MGSYASSYNAWQGKGIGEGERAFERALQSGDAGGAPWARELRNLCAPFLSVLCEKAPQIAFVLDLRIQIADGLDPMNCQGG